MKCHKCGYENNNKTIRCANCGTRIAMLCPDCNTLNEFGNKNCKTCNFELLKRCSVCNTLNIYSATNCRKCNSSFQLQDENIQNIIFEAKPVETSTKEETEIEQLNEPELEINDLSEENISSEQTVADEFLQEINSEDETSDDDLIIEENNIEETDEAGLSDFSEIEEFDENFDTDNNIQTKDIIYEKNNKNVGISEQKEEQIIQNIQQIKETLNSLPQSELEQFKPKNISKDDDVSVEEKSDSIFPEINISQNAKINQGHIISEELRHIIQEASNKSEEENETRQSQRAIIENVSLTIKSSVSKNVLAINGPEGCGKTTIINQVGQILKKNDYMFLYGSCTPLIQITSFGFFQDAFLRMLGFPPYTKSVEAFIKDFKKSSLFFLFNFLTPIELKEFFNLLYPNVTDTFDKIYANKQAMFSILEKIIKAFSLNHNLVIAIDNFELLDGASYEFIAEMLEKGYFNDRIKLLVSYKENKLIQSYFDVSKVNVNAFKMYKIEKLGSSELIKSLSDSYYYNFENIITTEYLYSVIRNANGNALRLEQEIALLFDVGYLQSVDDKIIVSGAKNLEVSPKNFEELVKLRLNILAPTIKNILFTAATMGYRFSAEILCASGVAPFDVAENAIKHLVDNMFISQTDTFTFEFKSLTLWKLIYQEAKSDLHFKDNAEKLYNTLNPLILSSNLQKIISCKDALTKNKIFDIWGKTASLAAKSGDTNLYIIAQKQALKILDEIEVENSENIKAEKYKQIGKLLCEKSPNEAIAYLSNVLDYEIKENNIHQIIDLSSYFIKSCYIVGNYFGVTEATDTLIKALAPYNEKISAIDIAMIKSRKLKALLNIGNSEQIINLINEEILIELEKEIQNTQYAEYKELMIDTLLHVKTVLAKAYIMQGNSAVFDVIISLKKDIEKYEYNRDYYTLQVKILEAFANTMIGKITVSGELLNQISIDYKDKNIDLDILAEWNILNITNRLFLNQKEHIKEDLFELANFANNINSHFIKNIVKLLLGNILKEEGNNVKALEIYNEQINYFAKEKIAFGALLSWFLIVQISMDMGDDEKALNTATKSLEIAQSSKINNYLFIIYLQKCIAELYLRKNDITAAKMYIEKSIILAKKNDLNYQLTELYISYAECLQEAMREEKSYSSENVNIIMQMYEKAITTAQEYRLTVLRTKALKVKNEFKTFCQLNSLSLS